MGGLAGHLNHLYDRPDLPFGKIKKILSLASQGKLEFKEKIDGFNVYFSFRDDKAVIARNKSNAKEGGLDLSGISQREFAGGDDIKKTFLNATKSFQNAIQTLPKKVQLQLFDNGKIWYNSEILGPGASNVLNYDKNSIKIHSVGHIRFNPETNELEPFKDDIISQKLDKIIDRMEQQTSGEDFQLRKDAVIELKNLQLDKSLKIAKAKIDQLISSEELSDANTIEDYLRAKFTKYVKQQLPEISEDIINAIVENLLGKSRIPTGLSKELRSKITQIKAEQKKLYKTFIFPLEGIVHDFATDLLQGMESAFILDNKKESQRLKSEVEKAISSIRSSGNEEANAILAQQLQKLKDLDNISSTVEGVVFEYEGNVYKFTGSFAPINQLLGLFRYGRGKNIPPSELVEKIDELDERSRKNKIIALVPGGFKPPHAGHYAIAKYFSDMSEIDLVKILISPKERTGHSVNNRVIITAEMSLKIWQIYLKNDPKIKVEISPDASPVKSVYEYFEKVNPGDTIVLGLGEKEKERNDTRFLRAQDYINKVNPGAKIQIMSIPPQAGGISGSEIRELVATGDKIGFMKNIPSHLSQEEKEEVWNIVSSQERQLAPAVAEQREAIEEEEKKKNQKNTNLQSTYQYISELINEVIKKTPNKNEWCVYSEKSNKNLGCSNSKKGAQKRLGQVEYFKNIKEEEQIEEISSMSSGAIEGAPGNVFGQKRKDDKDDFETLEEYDSIVYEIFEEISPETKEKIENLKPKDVIKVYHGTTLSDLPLMINGFDATTIHPRYYGGPKHAGIFVTPDIDEAIRFAHYGEAVLELLVRVKNLHGVSYSGTITKKQDHDPKTTKWIKDKYPNSFRPHLSMTMLQKPEPQALLLGLVNPNQILQIRYKPSTQDEPKWYTRKEFVELGVIVPKKYHSGSEEEKVKDVGYKKSSTTITVEQFFNGIAKELEYDLQHVKETFKRYSDSPNKEVLKSLIGKFLNGEKAINAMTKKISDYYNQEKKALEEHDTQSVSNEPYQKLMRKLHPAKKERLIGKGGQETDVAGSPYREKPDMKRSKSAPPISLEELYNIIETIIDIKETT